MYMLYIGTISAAHACITLLVVLLAHHRTLTHTTQLVLDLCLHPQPQRMHGGGVHGTPCFGLLPLFCFMYS